MDKSIIGQIKQNKAVIAELAQKHNLSLVLIFGSQVTGKTHPQSDVDLAVSPKKKLRLAELADIQFAFSQELGIKDLELVDLKSASPLLMKQIADKSILLYEEEPSSYARFKIYAFKLYIEVKPLLKLRELSLNKFLQKA